MTQPAIQIQDNVPIPPRGDVRYTAFPFLEMRVGQSFFTTTMSVKQASWSFGQKHHRKFAVRSVEENGQCGYRCWRVE